MFSHEKLSVYQKAVTLTADMALLCTAWDRKHSFVDHLSRASESVVLNLAEAARIRVEGAKQIQLDYAVGSALECAACLDIALIKELVRPENACWNKRRFCEVVKMLVGLKKSWARDALREESPDYGDGDECSMIFAHERLIVYRTALEFIHWFQAQPGGRAIASRLYRQVDKAATSMVLNVAEGNGRFGLEDRRRFLDIAEASAVKASVYLDLCSREEGPELADIATGNEILDRVSRLLTGWRLASSLCFLFPPVLKHNTVNEQHSRSTNSK